MRTITNSVILGLLLLGSFSPAQTIDQCLPCHSARDFSVRADDGRVINMYIDSRRYSDSAHGELACHQCHVNMAGGMGSGARVSLPAEVQPYIDKYRPDTRPAGGSCVTCHEEQWKSYQGSIHAGVLRSGKPDAPFCSDCHGSHYILAAADLESTVNPTHVPATCATCHAVGVLMSRYDVRTNTYQTFQQSVHGRKLALGEEEVPTCTSCHGVHNIDAPTNPDSPLHPNHRPDTCRRCHKGASDEFAQTFKHVTPSPTEDPVIYYVQMIYNVAIAGMIGVMAAFVALDLIRRTVEWSRRRKEVRQ